MSLQALSRPPAREAEGALVLFHGRGADEYDLLSLLDALDPERRLAGFAPRGPLSFPPGGAHWYRLHRVGQPDPETFNLTYGLVSEWLDGLGFPSNRTVIGGFSQGAVMSYALGLGRGRPRPAAIVAFSGFVPTVPGFELDLSEPLPPLAIGHGTHDQVIPVDWGRRAHELFPQALYRESPLAHTIEPRFVGEVSTWLSPVIGSPSRDR